ncbi:type II toxin-antitoxin system RelE/ParE family toxin [Bacteroides sp. 519]|uniref:type II toxin-antitoxin system RelE/ParE family toxin n=1 Tax=Bacteroides sp. 519 TaxID=2302937 RepID=UPI0013D513D7|nr:type II toxin-antitoxin system RelE/ParE family toxin [Bacteroides sp. 519]NDV60060.1 type II toxin-antitoxin system RelE/ParE family toxin [Bacteroides sp. 519]
MKKQRTISAYKNYFRDFIDSIKEEEARKVFYVIEMLKTQERVSTKFVKYLCDEIYEIRVMYNGNIFRVFFIFDNDNIVILFNGFQKKTQKTPTSEIEKALKLKEEYYESKE